MSRVILEGTDIEIRLAGTPELRQEIRDWQDSKCSDHPNREWRRHLTSNGGFQVRQQCMDCGYIIGGARKQTPTDLELKETDPYAYDAYEAVKNQEYAAIQQKHARLQYEKSNSFFEEYNQYLLSEEWRAKRDLVLRRCGGICEGCGSKTATQVHHLTYEHKMKEFLFELIGVCQECHDRLHGKEVIAKTGTPEDTRKTDADDDAAIWVSPCCGCRHDGEIKGVFRCFYHELPVDQALAEDGPCGPNRYSFEPCR